MKPDKYTKVIMTIIALNLTILSMKNLDIIPQAHAEEVNPLHGLSAPINYGLIPLNKDGGIDVSIKSFSPIGTVDVNIERVGGPFLTGTLPVEIKNDVIEAKMDR